VRRGAHHRASALPIAEISRKVPVSPQAVSQVAERLESLGYLERRSGERGRGVALHAARESLAIAPDIGRGVAV